MRLCLPLPRSFLLTIVIFLILLFGYQVGSYSCRASCIQCTIYPEETSPSSLSIPHLWLSRVNSSVPVDRCQQRTYCHCYGYLPTGAAGVARTKRKEPPKVASLCFCSLSTNVE